MPTPDVINLDASEAVTDPSAEPETTRMIDDYSLYPRPKLVAAVPDNFSDGIDFFCNTGGDEGYFAVLRKSRW